LFCDLGASYRTQKEEAMQCPDCKRLRHNGPCEPVYEDEPTELDLLEMDYEFAKARFEAAKAAAKEQRHEPV